jgi:ribose transport system ATP-binding protein
VSFITENRREEGLIMTKTVKDNLVLVYLKKLGGGLGAVNRAAEEAASEKAVGEVKIKTYDKNTQAVQSLSGGNQQKVVIGKWLLMEPRVFILDEPTRGIDVGAKLEIYNYINTLALKGSAVLFISSEMEELMGVCDRILVMAQGQIAAEFSRTDFDQERMMRYAVGGKGCHDE